MRDGTLPRAREALLADALGTVAGAALGTSTVTAYIESGAGVAAGGRTGLAGLVTAALFLLSLFFYPLVRMIGGGYPAGRRPRSIRSSRRRSILVGTLMIGGLRHVAVGRSDRGDSGVPDGDPHAARGEHHRGRGVRPDRYAVLKPPRAAPARSTRWSSVFAALFVARYAFLR